METIWEHSIDSEVQRLIHCAHQISIGFYQINGFVILPTGSDQISGHIVSFPKLDYCSIPRFWSDVAKIETTHIPFEIPSKLFIDTKSLLEKSNIKPSRDQKNLKTIWEKHQDKIMETIYSLIPYKSSLITSLKIITTNFGTTMSFNSLSHGQVALYLRTDQNISTIVEGILSSLTRSDITQKLEGSWSESEMVVDWLISCTKLASVLRSTDSDYLKKSLTLKNIRSQQDGQLNEISQAFLNQIGSPSASNIFSLNKNNQPLVRNKPIKDLTQKEERILSLLITSSPGLVKYDDIGNVLFGENEDSFSLYAITKTIQRLRDKLETNGVSGSHIQTIRRRGYLLVK